LEELVEVCSVVVLLGGCIGAGATITAAGGTTATIGAGATTIGAAAGAGATVVVDVVVSLVSVLSANPIEALPSSDAIPKASAAVLNEYFMIMLSPLFCSEVSIQG
jgi:hypothetical protein